MKHSKFRKLARKIAREEGLDGLVVLLDNLPRGIKPRHLIRALAGQNIDLDFIKEYEASRASARAPLVRPRTTKGPAYYKRMKLEREEPEAGEE